jgi:putative transposase
METHRDEVMTDLTQGMKEMKEKESRIPLMKSSNNRNSRVSESKDSVSWSRESGFQTDPSLKVQVASFSSKWKLIERLSKEHNLPMLCDIARVSLSGYYAFKQRVSEKRTQEDREEEDIAIIRKKVEQGKRKYGYRTVTMKLIQDETVGSNGLLMNHKKVLRLMKKYNFLAKIREKNPYKQIQKATQEHNTASNLLNREFTGDASSGDTSRHMIPYKILWTDITYLRLNNRWTYLSLLKDMISWEALGYKLSPHLGLSSVQDTLDQLREKAQKDRVLQEHLRWAYIHSDQWFHYTHPSFWGKIKDMGCIQSMSRRWNCIDNAPTESFFGHMKDELDLKSCKTFEELEKHIENYIFYYNNHRPQWNKKKMTPVAYRNHLLEQQSKKQQKQKQI